MGENSQPMNDSKSYAETPMRDLPPHMAVKAVERIWSRMSAIYGAGRWLEHAPESAMDEWQQILGYRTLTDIGRGLARYEADPGRYPPGAAEFRIHCAEHQPGTFAGAAAPTLHTPMKSIADMRPHTAVGRRWMAYMRLRGLIPMGAHTMEDIDRDLGDADVEEMDLQVARGTEAIRARA